MGWKHYYNYAKTKLFHNVILLFITIIMLLIAFVDMSKDILLLNVFIMGYLFVIHLVIPVNTDTIVLNKFIKYLEYEIEDSEDAKRYYNKLMQIRENEE